MGPADNNGSFILHGELREGLGHGQVRNLKPGELDRLWIELCNHIAHDDQIRDRIQVLGAIPFKNRDGQPFKKVAHGRIHILIRTRDKTSFLFKNASQGGHPRATDTHKVHVMWFGGRHIERGRQFSKRCLNVVFNAHIKFLKREMVHVSLGPSGILSLTISHFSYKYNNFKN